MESTELQPKSLDVLPQSRLDLEDARAAMKGANLVIGARMHACLNALSVGTPAIAMAYSRKFRPLLDSLGWAASVSLADRPGAGDILAPLADPSLADQARGAMREGQRQLETLTSLLADAL